MGKNFVTLLFQNINISSILEQTWYLEDNKNKDTMLIFHQMWKITSRLSRSKGKVKVLPKVMYLPLWGTCYTIPHMYIPCTCCKSLTGSPSSATMPKMLEYYQPSTQKPMAPLSRIQGTYSFSIQYLQLSYQQDFISSVWSNNYESLSPREINDLKVFKEGM